MKSSLPAYIKTYSLGTRKAVSDIIITARQDSRSAASIAQSLQGLSSLNQYNGIVIAPYTLVSFEAFLDFFRDINLKTIDYYDTMNSATTVLNSYVSILNSELAKLEKDVNQLDIFVNNYSFISGEDDLYNGSFVETFSDDSNSYLTENFQNKQYDRDGSEITLDEIASVDSVPGHLKAGTRLVSLGFNPRIEEYKNNYTQYISSSSDYYNLFNEQSTRGWNTTIKSPIVITSRTEDFSDIGYDYSSVTGATGSLTMVFENPQTMNCIRISPNLGADFQLLQVILYSAVSPQNSGSTGSSTSSSSEVANQILSSPLLVDSVKDISFNQTLIRKVKLIFNQPRYKRISNTASIYEQQSKIIDYFIAESRSLRAKKHDKLQDVVYSYFLKRNEIATLSSNPNYIPNYYSYRYPCDTTDPNYGSVYEFLSSRNTFTELNNNEKLKNTSRISKIVESIVQYVLGDKYRMTPNAYVASAPTASVQNISSVNFLTAGAIGNIQSSHGSSRQDLEPYIQSSDRFDLIRSYDTLDKVNYYEYNFSIKSFTFGNIIATGNEGANKSKAFFVSKMIDTGGYVNSVKVKSNYFIPKKSGEDSNLPESAAIEFYVTTNSSAQREIDWVPILPNNSNIVEAEMLFPSETTGIARLRFPADSASLIVYEQNKKIENNRIVFSDSNSITSFKILNYNSAYIYVAKYTVHSTHNANEVDFSKSSIQSFSLKTYSSYDGLGEKLSTVGSENQVSLSYDPYIDYSKFTNHIYSKSSGTVGSSGVATYAPISVILEDGTPAINLTNYLPNKYVKYELPINANIETYYIQNGNNITFSKKSTNLRVYYDFVPESLRYKIVLRNLDAANEMSAYVDDFVLKYQQKNTDNLTDKLLKVI